VQVLKIEREQQKAAEQAWLSEFHPREGAKYTNRSAGLHSSRHSADGSCFGHSSSGSSSEQARPVTASTAAFGDQQDGNCDASGWVIYPDDETADDHVATSSSSSANETHSESCQQDAAFEQEASVTATVAAECAAARAAATAAAAVRNAPAPVWWEADSLLAQRVHQVLQPSLGASSGSYCCSATLDTYDALLAANAERAAQLQAAGQLQGEVLLQQLQTREQLHDAWVRELGGRRAAQRLHQVLVESAGVH
jgi:hypothetical protein